MTVATNADARALNEAVRTLRVAAGRYISQVRELQRRRLAGRDPVHREPGKRQLHPLDVRDMGRPDRPDRARQQGKQSLRRDTAQQRTAGQRAIYRRARLVSTG